MIPPNMTPGVAFIPECIADTGGGSLKALLLGVITFFQAPSTFRPDYTVPPVGQRSQTQVFAWSQWAIQRVEEVQV